METAGRKRAIVVLTPSESKRLIAIGVSAMPEVKGAMRKGRIIIAGGTTNAYVAEELTGQTIDTFWYTAGRITDGELGSNEREKRLSPIVLVHGKQVDRMPNDVLGEFTEDDVFIKGANAIDPSGAAGILMGDSGGGTIGFALGTLKARGSHVIIPVGLEKLVPSVSAASGVCGQGAFQHAMGDPVGLMPIVGAEIVTEIEAITLLYGLRAVHVASGGVAGSEGSVVLVIEGEGRILGKAFRFLKKRIKGEPPVTR